MKAEIELEKFGDCVELEFSWTYNRAEPDVGYMEGWYEFEPDYYTPFDDEGKPMVPVNANGLEITDHLYDQLADSVRSTWEG